MLALCLMCALPLPAPAAFVTFDGYTDSFFGDNDPGNGLTVAAIEGFNFTSSADHFHVGSDMPGNPGDTGALLNDISLAVITMAEAGGRPFDLQSAGLAAVTLTDTPFVTVTGYFSGGGTIVSTVAVTPQFGAAQFTGFTGLSSVTFQGSGGNNFGNQFWLDDVGVEVVPLPAAAWLFATGVAATLRSLKRRAMGGRDFPGGRTCARVRPAV